MNIVFTADVEAALNALAAAQSEAQVAIYNAAVDETDVAFDSVVRIARNIEKALTGLSVLRKEG